MKKLSGLPLFLALLPVFFVFHGFVENIGLISIADCLPILAIYLLSAAVLFLVFFLLLRNAGNAALMSFYLLFFYFFFGAIHDFLKDHAPLLSRYSVLLPLLAAGALALYLYLRKKKISRSLVIFLNCLFFVYLLIDTGTWITAAGRRSVPAAAQTSLLSPYYKSSGGGAKPDIYLLLFDEYSASRTLRSVYGYDNSGLDSFLRKEDFYLPRQCRSNYYYTIYSMSSMLNLAYHAGIPDSVDAGDNARIIDKIRTNEAVNFLIARGYKIVNLSPWDLPGNPAYMDQPFIPLKTKLITRRTMLEYVSRDIGWWFAAHLTDSVALENNDIMGMYRYNTSVLARTGEESAKPSSAPRFVYMHVFMPHFWYLFDSLQHWRSLPDIRKAPPEKNAPRHYIEYLPYVNARIRELIGTIKRNTGGKAVILFMSDHGHRYDPDNVPRPYFFDNQNAIYFPDKDYSRLYDSMTNVNQFRLVYNKLFGLNLPLLKDSVIFLHEIGDENAFN